MRAIAKLLIVSVIFGIPLGASPARATTVPLAGWTVSTLALGQTSDAEMQRRYDKWLDEARLAMKQGDYSRAEALVAQAERVTVKHDPIMARFKDSPAKVRKDLAAARQGRTPGGLGNLFNRDSSPATPPADPYAQPASNATGAPANRSSAFQAGVGQDWLPQGASPAAPANSNAKSQSDKWLYEARQAVAGGDLPRAQQLVSQAKQLGVSYPLHGDSPAKLDTLIATAQRFVQGVPAGADPQAYTRDFAQFLMDQSEGLLTYGQFAAATSLARQAQSLNANYAAFDRTPKQMLDQISAAQRVAASQPAAVAQRGGGTSSISDQGAGPARLPQVDPRTTAAKTEVMRLVAQARVAMDRGDIATAQTLAKQAEAINVPDEMFAANETRPWEILLDLQKAGSRYPVAQAANFQERNAHATLSDTGYPVQSGFYNPNTDTSRVVAAQATSQDPVARDTGMRHFKQGMDALIRRDRATALTEFREAWRFKDHLDAATQQQLQDKLSSLQVPANGQLPPGRQPGTLQAVDAQQQLVQQKLYREITNEVGYSQRMASTDPTAAMDRLEKLRVRVNESEVDATARKAMLTMVDRRIQDLEQFIEQNRAEIDLNARNREVLSSVNLDRERREEVRNELARLVEDFNDLMDEQRYAEAEVKARQARELDPDSAVVQNMTWKSRFVRRIQEQMAISERKEQAFYDAVTDVEVSSEAFDSRRPYRHGDPRAWENLSQGRAEMMARERRQWTEKELEIQRSLKNPVQVSFNERPLAEVMDMLSQLSNVPIYLDPQGLAAEGVTTDVPVTIRLAQQISLRSALNLILEPLRLSYVIQNEVLKITSEQTRNSNVYPKVYNVADLVIPIPNFLPSYNIGLPGAIQSAHNALGYGAQPLSGAAMPLTVASNNSQTAPVTNASVLAQMGASGMINSLSSKPSMPNGYGAGGMGGAALADFDTLIELITSTISPDSWDEVGGAGAIEAFPSNLSLVISQTQDVHEQIADLLDQLRRLQDLQVTIEVRFITLNDNWFERLGIDFDFDIDDNVNVDNIQDDHGPSVVIGLDEGGPTLDLDLAFTQDSFAASVPQFGGFDAGTAANFGFAILSDIEVFFLIQAAEGDQRTNVLQAPKVTLFNGQTASVSDVSQRPFVTSIIPVVGDFAAAQQPVIVVLNEGTSLNVQAVVSSDRRFVRLTLVPFFSRIGDVEEFTFEGTTTTDTGSNVVDDDDNIIGVDNNVIHREGTTVQLPTFVFTTVTTTVSVPDGGTVLLGGIKRLSEGRSERGVPMLSKLPYVNRLFKNIGIGRTTQSLMMMVTPRIIIQEEEEFAQTGYDSSR